LELIVARRPPRAEIVLPVPDVKSILDADSGLLNLSSDKDMIFQSVYDMKAFNKSKGIKRSQMVFRSSEVGRNHLHKEAARPNPT